MKIIHIATHKRVKKTKKELREEIDAYGGLRNKMLISEDKFVPSKEPLYIVEMSAKELQLISFYLELENRKPILNVEIDTEIKRKN